MTAVFTDNKQELIFVKQFMVFGVLVDGEVILSLGSSGTQMLFELLIREVRDQPSRTTTTSKRNKNLFTHKTLIL